MKSKFLNRRELLVLGLPCLLIGAGIVILTGREKKRIARESGPLRMVVSKSQVIPISAREAWQGYDLKYQLDYELQGTGASNEQLEFVRSLSDPKKSYLRVQSNGENKSFFGELIDPSFYSESHVDVPLKIVDGYGLSTTSLQSTVLIDRDAFPGGKASLTVQSQFRGFNAKNQQIITPVSNWSHTIDEDIQPLNINRNSPKLISNKYWIGPPIVGKYLHELDGVDTRLTKLALDWDLTDFDVPKYNRVEFLKSRFEDSKGNEVIVKNESDRSSKTVFYRLLSTLNKSYDEKYKAIPNQGTTEIKLDLSDVPKQFGALYLRSNFSLNDSWTTPIRVEVRPQWVCQKTNKLKIEEVVAYETGVMVDVRYVGKNPVDYESHWFDRPYFSSMKYGEDYDFPITKGRDRLITNWSQHLEGSKEPIYINKPVYTKPIKAKQSPTYTCEVRSIKDLGNGLYRIFYAVDYPSDATMKFKAEIGIWGDGLMPIETTIFGKS